MTFPATPNHSSPRRLGAWALTLSMLTSLLVFYALHGAMGFNMVQLPLEEAVQTQHWLPQGWAFFTRDPQEERLFVYQRDEKGAWRPASLTPHGRPENAFGMDRASRAQGVEVGQLYEQLRARAFSACQGDTGACLEALTPSATFDNRMPHKTLCGAVGIVKRKPLPFAWNAWEKTSHMPEVAVRLEVRC